jgi:hypothetical protein
MMPFNRQQLVERRGALERRQFLQPPRAREARQSLAVSP